MYAGIYDSTFVYHHFSPPLKIKTELDTITGFSSGSDSIDLDLDGNFDLIINIYLHLSDTAYEVGSKRFFPYCKLLFRNNFEVATKGYQYACGHGYCNYAPFVDAFEYDTEISHYKYDWYLGSEEQTMWLITPSGSGFPPGWWYYADKEMYIGIRIKEQLNNKTDYYRYGWIKVNAHSFHDLTFIDFALE